MCHGLVTRPKSVSLSVSQSWLRKPASTMWIRQVLGLRIVPSAVPGRGAWPVPGIYFLCFRDIGGALPAPKVPHPAPKTPTMGFIVHTATLRAGTPGWPQTAIRTPLRLFAFPEPPGVWRSTAGCWSYLCSLCTKALEAGGQGPVSHRAVRVHKSS